MNLILARALIIVAAVVTWIVVGMVGMFVNVVYHRVAQYKPYYDKDWCNMCSTIWPLAGLIWLFVKAGTTTYAGVGWLVEAVAGHRLPPTNVTQLAERKFAMPDRSRNPEAIADDEE